MAHDPHAAHASADDEYLNPASGSGHEHTDANVSMIIQFAIWLTASAIMRVLCPSPIKRKTSNSRSERSAIGDRMARVEPLMCHSAVCSQAGHLAH